MERLKTFTDKRGSLTLLEVGQDIPFESGTCILDT